MTKIEKLREVNANLTSLLMRLETYMFIEKIDSEDKTINLSESIKTKIKY